MLIKINGITQNLDDFSGTENMSFVYRQNQQEGNAMSPNLTVTGSAFNLLYNLLVNVPNPSLAFVTFDAYDDCCKTDTGQDVHLFSGIIRGSGVVWCEVQEGISNCEMTVTVEDNSNDAQRLQCLKNVFPWDRLPKFDGSGISLGEDTTRTAPFLTYCIDVRPGFLQEIVFILGTIIIFALSPILLFLGGALAIAGVIPNATFFIDQLRLLLIGCGYKHKTPYIHSYLQNMCDVCGLNLVAPDFEPTGYYYDTVRLDAAYKAGRKITSRILAAYELNKPNLNGVQFLDAFKDFNLHWRVYGSALILKRKDQFGTGIFFDATTNSDKVISLCFQEVERPFAYAEYSYVKDGIDNTGDETNPDWVERAIDWNIPPNPNQAGLYSKTFPYGTAQFRADSGRDNVSALDKDFYIVFYPELNDFDGAMLMERGICGVPKLLNLQAGTPQDDARVMRYDSLVSDTYDYNTKWWVKLNYIDGFGGAHDTIYQKFLEIDDPRAGGVKLRPYTLVFKASCEYIKGLDLSEVGKLDKIMIVPMGGMVKVGTIDEIEYSVSGGTITVSGRV